MRIELANETQAKEVIRFLDKHLSKDDKSVIPEEFLCPFGVRAAIKRKQLIVGLDRQKIISALRFYRRKKDGITSIYQFAINESYPQKTTLKQMLRFTGHNQFEFSYPRKDIYVL